MKPIFPLAAYAVVGLALTAFAGTGNYTPSDGHHGLVRTNPSPEVKVADGDFDTGGGGSHTMHLNPEAGGSTDWTQNPTTGQYEQSTPPSATKKICFYHWEGPPVSTTYEYKISGVVQSSGYLTPP